MMSREQQDAIENLMARGLSRVQATKVFYENSLQQYTAKNNSHYGSFAASSEMSYTESVSYQSFYCLSFFLSFSLLSFVINSSMASKVPFKSFMI